MPPFLIALTSAPNLLDNEERESRFHCRQALWPPQASSVPVVARLHPCRAPAEMGQRQSPFSPVESASVRHEPSPVQQGSSQTLSQATLDQYVVAQQRT